MPLLALKAHYDGHTVIFDEPCALPPETPLLVVVNPLDTSAQTIDNGYSCRSFSGCVWCVSWEVEWC